MLQRRMPYIPNGKSKGRRPSDFDPSQLAVGTKVEMEHTTDRRVAQRIAMDHLTEDRSYYRKLAKIHLDGRGRNFGDATCSHTSRAVRGGLGTLIGAVIGGMIGGGVALAVTTTQFEVTAPIEAVKRAKNMALVATGITVLGAVGGLVLGTAKPEC